MDSRYYQPSRYGFVCFVYIKEGQDAGLVQYLAQGCKASEKEDLSETAKAMVKDLPLTPGQGSGGDSEGESRSSCCMVVIDGILVGYVHNSDSRVRETAQGLHWTQKIRLPASVQEGESVHFVQALGFVTDGDGQIFDQITHQCMGSGIVEMI